MPDPPSPFWERSRAVTRETPSSDTLGSSPGTSELGSKPSRIAGLILESQPSPARAPVGEGAVHREIEAVATRWLIRAARTCDLSAFCRTAFRERLLTLEVDVPRVAPSAPPIDTDSPSLRARPVRQLGGGFLWARQARFPSLSRGAWPARMSRTDFCHPDRRDENPHLVCSRGFVAPGSGAERAASCEDPRKTVVSRHDRRFGGPRWSVDLSDGEPTREAWALSSHGDSTIEPLVPQSTPPFGPRGFGLRRPTLRHRPFQGAAQLETQDDDQARLPAPPREKETPSNEPRHLPRTGTLRMLPSPSAHPRERGVARGTRPAHLSMHRPPTSACNTGPEPLLTPWR